MAIAQRTAAKHSRDMDTASFAIAAKVHFEKHASRVVKVRSGPKAPVRKAMPSAPPALTPPGPESGDRLRRFAS